jgi:DNA-binding IclR family transcriptional regulator
MASNLQSAASGGTQAIERGLRLLDLLADGPLSTRELSERMDLPRSTVARLLGALERYRYAARGEDGTYQLGTQVLQLAARWHRQTGLVAVAEPHLERLAHSLRETGQIMIREGRHAICVAYVESPEPIRLSINLGMQLPLHASALGKLLLAYAPESLAESILSGELQRFSRTTIVDVDELRREIAKIQQLGFAESRGEVDQGVNAIAAPIRIAGGNVIASIGVSGPEERMNRITSDRLRSETVAAAREISLGLGYAS